MTKAEIMDTQLVLVAPGYLIGFIVLSLVGQLYKLYPKIRELRQRNFNSKTHLQKEPSSDSSFPIKKSTSNSIWEYIFKAPELLSSWYKEAAQVPLLIRTLRNHIVVVASDEHVDELTNAPDTVLSLHAIAKDMFKPKHTMYGFKVHDSSPLNGSVHARVLRTLLTSKLPTFIPALRGIMTRAFSNEVLTQSSLSRGSQGFSSVSTMKTSQKLVAQINSYCFVGSELAENDRYVEAAMNYAQDVAVTGEILQFFPEAWAPLVTNLCTRGQRSQKIMLEYVRPIVEKHLAARRNGECSSSQSNDCLHWIIDCMARRETCTVEEIIQEFLALWFGSVHQLSMSLVYALYDIIDHPEYLPALRSELKSRPDWYNDIPSLHLLNSFVKESARLHPSDSISTRRKALEDYTFKDGTVVPKGDWICTPLREILRNPQAFQNPESFDGYRFVPNTQSTCSATIERAGAAFTDLKKDFPLWGLGKHACPGRFYASNVLKLMLGSIIESYDFAVDRASEKNGRTFVWRSAIVPRTSVRLLVRPIGVSGK